LPKWRERGDDCNSTDLALLSETFGTPLNAVLHFGAFFSILRLSVVLAWFNTTMKYPHLAAYFFKILNFI